MVGVAFSRHSSVLPLYSLFFILDDEGEKEGRGTIVFFVLRFLFLED